MIGLKTLYVFLLISFSLLIKAQIIQFENFTAKDGLISDEVYNLHQDNNGYIWLFTNYGAMKYDGKEFKPVLKNIPFNESFIYCIYENEKGNKWVVNSNAKIFKVINDSAFLVNGTEKASNMICKTALPIYQICVDDSFNILLSSHRTSYKLVNNKNYDLIKISNSDIDNSFKADIIEFKGGHLFSSFNHDANTIKTEAKKKLDLNFIGNNFFKKSFKIDYNSGSVPTHFKKYFNDLYFSNQNLLYKIEKFKLTKKLNFKGFVLNYTKDSNKHLWVGCYNDGLYELNENDSIVNHYFENKTINDVLIDSQNGLWISTEGFGLYHCRDLNVFCYTNLELSSGSISFIKEINDKLFIANSRGTLFLKENNKLIKIHDENLLIGEPLDIIQIDDGYLITYRYGAEVLKLHKKSLAKIVTINDFRFHAYKMLKEENDTIIYMVRKGINVRVKDKLIKMLRYDFKTNSVIKRNGAVLIATDHGVFQIVDEKLIMPSYLFGTKNTFITKIVVDNENNYWFCSKGSGLFKLTRKNELMQYTVSDDLPSNIINDISFSNDNSMLLSTNKGLFYNNELNSLKSWNELYKEGIKSALMHNHIVYLATNNGLVTIRENSLNANKRIYINIKSIMVNEVVKNENSLNQLRYNENNLEFYFDIVSYSTSLPKIKYELSGDKTEEGVRLTQQLNFHNLDAGHYKLKISLLSNEKLAEPIIIEFTIISAIWQRLWFKFLVLLVSLAFCFLIGWEVFKYYKKKEDKKNEINKLITEYKLVALKAQINPHFISNCLTAIQQLIISNKLDEANQYLARFSFLVRQVLNFSSKSTISLIEELAIVELNIELEQLRFDQNFEFILEIDKEIDSNEIFVPPLICQPLVENAIWHGLLQLKNIRKGRLFIKIKLIADLLYIIIEDNGVGRSFNLNMVRELKESKGIEITKQRILNINNLYQVSTGSLNFEDLKDEMNNCIGTRVVIILPLITNNE